MILSESPAKKRHQKTQFCILGGCSSSSPEVVCHSKLHLNQSALGHLWAQAQFVENTSSPLAYKVYKRPALIRLRDLSCPHLWDWRAHPGVALFKYTCSFTSSLWLVMAYCVGGETYYHVTEGLLVSSKGNEVCMRGTWALHNYAK